MPFETRDESTAVSAKSGTSEIRAISKPAEVGKRSWLKRAFDVTTAVTLLLAGAPLLLLIASLIKATSPGPVLFVQKRAGKGERPFSLYKFRTMHTGCSERAHRRFAEDFINGDGSFTSRGDGKKKYGIPEDSRITRIGRILRATCLDELPQLLNVIRGEMSMVGPRPPLYYELQYYSHRHRRRLSVTPGLTGLWQVRRRSVVSFEEMVQLDLHYIDNWSLSMDVKIILKTMLVLLIGAGRY